MAVEILSALPILKTLWDSIRGTGKVKKEETNLLADSGIRKDFLNNNPDSTIIYVQGDFYMADKSQLTSSDKDKLKKIYENNDGDSNKNFEIIKTDFFDRVQEFKKELPNNKKINPFLKFLDSDLKTILNLSMYTKKLFDNRNFKEAQKVKEDIGFQYGKEGRKLCNLYLSGYIGGMTEFLIQLYEGNMEEINKSINSKIKKFVHDSDYIIFIHQASNIEDVSNEIRMLIIRNKPYIAIHGAGSMNIEKIKVMLNELEEEILGTNYDVTEENLRTLSLCPLLNVYLKKK